MSGSGDHIVRLGIRVVCNPLEVGGDQAPGLLDQIEQAFATASFGRLEIVRSAGIVKDPGSAVKVGRFFYDQRVDALCVLAAT
jgi:hypothetical protein